LFKKKKENKKVVMNTEANTKHAARTTQAERQVEKKAYMFRYTYAGIREMMMQMEKEDRHMSGVMHTSIGTLTYVSIKFVQKEGEKQKGGYEYRSEHKTCSTRNTGNHPSERQEEKKAFCSNPGVYRIFWLILRAYLNLWSLSGVYLILWSLPGGYLIIFIIPGVYLILWSLPGGYLIIFVIPGVYLILWSLPGVYLIFSSYRGLS